MWAFTALLVAASATLWITRLARLHSVASPLHVLWLLVAVAFAVGNFAVVRVEFRDESHSLNLSDAALLPAIAFTSPEGAVLAAVVGYLVRAVWVRQSLVKAAFNVALRAFVATVAVLCYHAIAHTASVTSGRGWLAGSTAILAACVLSDGGVQVVIGLSAGRIALSGVGRLGTTFVTTLVAEVLLGFVAVQMVGAGALPASLFVLSAAVIAVEYAAYGRLRSRHATVSQLYRFDQALVGLTESAEVIGAVLRETLSLLNAGVAQLIVQRADEIECHTARTGHDQRVNVQVRPHPFVTSSQEVTRTVLVLRGMPHGEVHDAMAAAGFRDAVIVRVPTDSDVAETLVVANRLGGDNVTFHERDIALLETLAAHTAMALRSCRLLEQLREEVDFNEYQAHHDALTGLPNRALFSAKLDEAVAESPKAGVVGVLLMDLDGFKAINDTMGHDVGDVLLQKLGARLADVVGEQGLFARLGGDEFAVMLPDARDLAEVRELAERLSAAVEDPVTIAGAQVTMRASVGLTVAPHRGSDRSTLLRRADMAMYQAKRRGGGVALYDDHRSAAHVGNPMLISALREAIDTSTLEMYYQPKADLMTGEVLGVEALLRWTHAAYGLIGPDQAIPVAERSGLIRPLTLWALDTSLSQLAAWSSKDVNIDLAVNLSPALLADPAIVDDIGRLLKTHGVPASRLTLEVTESLLSGRQADHHGIADRLAVLGARLSIDDFGTGASSLARLLALPVNELKIDKSFIEDLVHSKAAATIVVSTIQLAHELGLTVVAEGVETREVWRHLSHLRCDVAQGFLLSRALPADQFFDWIQEQRRVFAAGRT